MNPLVLRNSLKSLKIGDFIVVLLSLLGLVVVYSQLWQQAPASRVQILRGNTVLGTYSLNQTRQVHVHGAQGEAVIAIADGRARFIRSPCTNQYCVHQGWLSRSGQAAVCLPNELIVQLLGTTKSFDSLSY